MWECVQIKILLIPDVILSFYPIPYRVRPSTSKHGVIAQKLAYFHTVKVSYSKTEAPPTLIVGNNTKAHWDVFFHLQHKGKNKEVTLFL